MYLPNNNMSNNNVSFFFFAIKYIDLVNSTLKVKKEKITHVSRMMAIIRSLQLQNRLNMSWMCYKFILLQATISFPPFWKLPF